MRAAASLALLGCLALAACNDGQGRSGMAAAGGKLCKPFPGAADAQRPAGQAAAPLAPPTDAAGAMDDCLHRWGYALASSADPAGDVAQAAVAACSTVLARWNQMGAAPGPDVRTPAEAPSLMTGETTNPIAERYAFAQNRALFYVVQARAGKCAAPPMRDGAPE